MRLQIICLFFCINSLNAQTSNGLIYHLSFDGNFKNLVDGKDYSNPNMANITFSNDRFENPKSCLLITGPNYGDEKKGISIPFNNQTVLANKEMTITMWFKKTGPYGHTLISLSPMTVTDANSYDEFSFSIGEKDVTVSIPGKKKPSSGPLLELERVGGGSYDFDRDFSCDDGKWHFITYYINDTTNYTTIDNLLISDKFGFSKFENSAMEALRNKEKLKIGCHSKSGSYLDEVSIYNRALSYKERDSLFFARPKSNELPPYKTYDTSPQTYYKNFCSVLIKGTIAKSNKELLLKYIADKRFLAQYFDDNDFRNILSQYDVTIFSNTTIYNDLKRVKTQMTNEANALALKQKGLAEIENKRVGYIKKATVGDLLIYTQDWQRTDSYLFGYFKKNTPYTMIIKCYIERIEGEKYQIRIADVSSSSNENYATPEIKGIKIHRGDIIWVKPFQDKNWFWGEDE